MKSYLECNECGRSPVVDPKKRPLAVGDPCLLCKFGGTLVKPKDVVLVKVKKLHPDAKIPTRMSEGASGFDLYACEEIACTGIGPVKVRTGIAIELPRGYEAQVRPRSSVPLKRALIVSNAPGTIDSDYRGEIHVIMHNVKPRYLWAARKGERIAQLVVKKVPEVVFKEVDELDDTERGEGGFGSMDELSRVEVDNLKFAILRGKYFVLEKSAEYKHWLDLKKKGFVKIVNQKYTPIYNDIRYEFIVTKKGMKLLEKLREEK
jgi:dUTP pyrophosphatase